MRAAAACLASTALETEQPTATVGGNLLDAAHFRTGHTRDAVVLGENVVDDHRVNGDGGEPGAVDYQQIFEEPHWLLGQHRARPA